MRGDGEPLSPEPRSTAMVVLQDRFRASKQRPVPLAEIEEEKLKRQILELAGRYVSWGRRHVYRPLRLNGWSVNHKRVRRIWREEGLQRPLPRRRKLSEYPHNDWAIDFQFDQTMDGHTLKFLKMADEFSRVCLAIPVGRRFQSIDVIDTIEELLKLYAPPTHLRMNNGPEFIAHALQKGAQAVVMERRTPRGSRWENPSVESFNGRFRVEFQ